MAIPQAPTYQYYNREEMVDLVEEARSSDRYGHMFQDKTDWESLELLRENFGKYRTKIPPKLSDFYFEHMKERDPNRFDMYYNYKNNNPQYDESNQLEQAKDRTWVGSIMGGAGIVDLLPFGLDNVFKAGANESITGLAAHLITGDAPFKLDENYDPGLLGGALAFGTSMLYDAWFFFLTDGIGLIPALAGGAAKKKAVAEVASILFKKEAVEKAGQLGIKGLAEKEVVLAVEKAVAGRGIRGATDNLLASPVRASSSIIAALADDAAMAAEQLVSRKIASREFLAEGLEKVSGQVLKEKILAPKLGTIVNHFGMRSAKALGLYNVVSDMERQFVESISGQVNPETGEPYGYGLAPSMYQRWKDGEPGLFAPEFEYDMMRTIYTGLHGFMGGYVAGALGGVVAAGKAGAFAEGGFEKYMAESHPVLLNKMYSHWTGIPLESLGFTGVGYLVEGFGDESQKGIPFHERYIQNLVTIGTLKGMHGMIDKFKKGGRKLEDKMLRAIIERKYESDKTADRLVSELSSSDMTAAERTLIEGIRENIERANKKYERETVAVQVKFSRLYELANKVSVGGKPVVTKKGRIDKRYVNKLTVEEIKEFEKIIRDVAELAETSAKELGGKPSLLGGDLKKDGSGYEGGIMNDPLLKVFFDDVVKTDAGGNKVAGKLFSSLNKDIEAAQKRAKSPDADIRKKEQEKEAPKNVARMIEDADKGTYLSKDFGGRKSEESVIEHYDKNQEEIFTGKSGTTHDKSIPNNIAAVSNKNNRGALKILAIRRGDTDKTIGKKIATAKLFFNWVTKTFGKNVDVTNISKKHGQDYIDHVARTNNSKATETKQSIQYLYNELLKINRLPESKGESKILKNLFVEEVSFREGILTEAKAAKEPSFTQEEKVTIDRKVVNKLEIERNIDKGDAKGETGYAVTEAGTIKIRADVGTLIWAVASLYGHRQVPLHGKRTSQEGKDFAPKLKNVRYSKDNKTITLDFTEKGHEGAITRSISFRKGIKVSGIELFKVLDSIYKRRSIETGGDGNANLLVAYDKSGKTKLLTRQYLHQALREISGKPKLDVHGLRSYVTRIAYALDDAGIKVPGAKNTSWAGENGFVNIIMMDHKNPAAKIHAIYSRVGEVSMRISQMKAVKKFWDEAKKLKQEQIWDVDTETLRTFEEQQRHLEKKEGGKKLQVWSPLNLITEMEPISDARLVGQIREVVSRNPGLKVLWAKDRTGAGYIERGIIRLIRGRSDETTIFHENAHRLKEFVLETGNKKLIELWDRGEAKVEAWAKANDKDRWDIFVREYDGKDVANEYLTQLTAEWSLTRFKASRIEKLAIWMAELFSGIKNYFGLGNPMDIARALGKITERGFSTEGHVFKWKKYQKLGSSEKASEAEVKLLDDILIEKGVLPETLNLILKYTGMWDPIKGMPIHGIGIREGRFEGVSSWQAKYLAEFISETFVGGSPVGRKKSWKLLNDEAHMIEPQYGIKRSHAKFIKEALNIPKGSLEHANEKQLKQYIDFIRGHGKEYPVGDSGMITEAMSSELAAMDSKYGTIKQNIAKLGLPLDYVLRKFGGKSGSRIADRLLDHYFYETRHVGEGMVYISSAINEFKSKSVGTKNLDFIPFILDKELLKPAILKDGTQIMPETPKGLEDFISRYNDGETSVKNGGKGTPEYRAVNHIRKMYDHYWNYLELYAREKIPNPRMFEKWKDNFDKKYVEDYFTRILTSDARKYFQEGSKGYEKAVESLVQDITLLRTGKLQTQISRLDNQIANSGGLSSEGKSLIRKRQKLEKDLGKMRTDALDNNTDLSRSIYSEAEFQLHSLLRRKRNHVTNKFLLPRVPRIDNVVIDNKGKQIQVYETSFERAAGQYIRVFSNYLSTVKTMNEFTNVKGDWSKSSGTPGDILRQMAGNSQFGQYVDRAVRRRIGLEETSPERTARLSALTQVGRYSALFGLSSPASGIKNFSIGTTMTIGVHGFRAFLHGVGKTFSPEAWSVAKRKGWLEIGTKELELTGWGQKWMKWVSWMRPSEQLNRVIGGFAGEFNARQLVSRMRGERFSMLGKEWGSRRAKEELGRMFKLKPEEVAFLENYGMDPGLIPFEGKAGIAARERMEFIIDKIQHYGHIKSQGATGDPFLPLWAGNPEAKALTLFYRMAYSATHNIFSHVIKPATRGNFLPMVRYTFAGSIGGAALWSFYEQVLGKKPPSVNEDDLAIIGQNLAKTEALGLFSFVLNPYAAPGDTFGRLLISDSIMQPAVLRNSFRMGEMIANILFLDNDINAVTYMDKLVKDTVVFFNHAEKYQINKKNPYKKNVTNLRTFRNQWLKSSGHWDEEQKAHNPYNVSSSVNAQYYRLIREAFLNNDLDSAARYYLSTWYYLYDSYRVINGVEQFYAKESKSRTDRRLTQVLNRMNPLDFSEETGKRAYSKRSAFLSYLNKEEAVKALDLEKTYHFRRRELNRKISSLWDEYGGQYKAGKIEDIFPIPPRGSFIGKKYRKAPKWKTSERMEAFGY